MCKLVGKGKIINWLDVIQRYVLEDHFSVHVICGMQILKT